MLTGSYNITAQTPLGDQEGVITIQADGTALTGSIDILNTVSEIENGSADGDSFKFDVIISTPFGSFSFEASGAVDGDDVSVEMQNPIFAVSVSGKRV